MHVFYRGNKDSYSVSMQSANTNCIVNAVLVHTFAPTSLFAYTQKAVCVCLCV